MGQSIGMGAMRLSTAAGRNEAAAIAVLHAAFDAGVTCLDTADAYGLDDHDAGHNERLIAQALSSWPGDRTRIRVATKGGMIRPQGAWVIDGRAGHLIAACENSRRALGVDRIWLYQLHAPDPRVPLTTSVRALAGLQRDGLIERIGLCNVTVGQIEEAQQVVRIDAVQIELSLWEDAHILSGVIGYCLANGIELIAYRPLGGPQGQRRLQTDPALRDLAARHDATPAEIALAWINRLSEQVVTIPGPSRPEHVPSIARAAALRLDDEDNTRLVDRFAACRAWRDVAARAAAPAAKPAGEGVVVMIMGLPAAGKTTLTQTFVAEGYVRLNRDEQGGGLGDLIPAMERAIDAGQLRVVLDNTYISRKSRAPVIHAAARRGFRVRCVWLDTSLEDAQTNAVERMLSKYGRLLEADEMRRISKEDINAFGPTVQFRFKRELEPPDPTEGFASVERRAFERHLDASARHRALICWGEDVLYRSRSGARSPVSPDDVELLPGRASALQQYASDGWRLLMFSWQPEIAGGTRTVADADAIFTRVRDLLGVAVDVSFCPHAAGPPACWCRKPLPGLGVAASKRYQIDPPRSIYVGAGVQDPGFARRLGVQYREADAFFDALL